MSTMESLREERQQAREVDRARRLAEAEERRTAHKAAQAARRAEEERRPYGSSPMAQRAVAAAMRFVFDWALMVGRKDALWVAGNTARVVAPMIREHRVARDNIAAAFPEKSQAERDAILAEAWDNLAASAIEYAYLDHLVAAYDPDNAGGLVEMVGVENVRQLAADQGPAIVFGAHLANWELSAAVGARMGINFTAAYRPPTNPYVAAEMEARRHYVRTMIASDGAAAGLARALRRKEVLALVVDQRVDEGDDIVFLGRPARSNPVVGILARLFDCPVHACWTVRLPGGRLRVELTPPLELPRDARGKVDAAATNIMVHRTIEGWIRKYPGQWLWMHDRWRR